MYNLQLDVTHEQTAPNAVSLSMAGFKLGTLHILQ